MRNRPIPVEKPARPCNLCYRPLTKDEQSICSRCQERGHKPK